MIGDKSIYELAYTVERPEIFFKANARRCVGHGEPICIRRDSEWTLPEPELGVVLDEDGTILGYTIVDDVTARDIERENPLYLPQAKIYKNSCAFGPFIVTPDEVKDPHNLKIQLRIYRGSKLVYVRETNTSNMKRRLEEQIEYLVRDNPIPPGTLFTTGTGILPGRDKALKHGDQVEITIEKLGTLRTPVVKLEPDK